jgi:sugar-specific transcriptional regulator TrmB
MQEQLKKLGLSEKESSVYLASLEMGQGTAQELAQKTGLRRPTVYFTIEQLKKRGLMSQFEKGKKTFFAAESPENLSTLIAAQEKETAAARSVLNVLLPELTGMFDMTGEKPRVRFFEGKEGLKAMQEDFLRTKEKNLVSMYSFSDYHNVFTGEERRAYREKRAKKNIFARGIYTRVEGPLKAGELPPASELRWVPRDTFPFTSDITVYGNKVAAASLKGRNVGVIIESQEIANTLRAVFELAWRATEQFNQR